VKTPLALFATLLLSSFISTLGAETRPIEKADVIVYGSTPGGFCAAIAAAREGASVVLLEPTQHVDGLSTGGLSHCDSNQMRRETLTERITAIVQKGRTTPGADQANDTGWWDDLAWIPGKGSSPKIKKKGNKRAAADPVSP